MSLKWINRYHYYVGGFWLFIAKLSRKVTRFAMNRNEPHNQFFIDYLDALAVIEEHDDVN